MNFIFISPQFPSSYWNFCDRLKARGVNVLGIGDASYDSLSEEVKRSLTEYYRVDSMKDYGQMYRAVAFFAFKYGKIDWLESNNEYWLNQDARLREDFHITTGMQPADCVNVRHKSRMKHFYQKAGVPVARYHLVQSMDAARAFIEEVGYPVFVKPDGGMGAVSSFKISNDSDLVRFFEEKDGESYIMEEFLTGDIWSYDGISDSNADILFETCTSFPPSIADIVNRNDHLAYFNSSKIPEDLQKAGRSTIKAFGVKSRFFHCEFFRLRKDQPGVAKKGEIVALEVNVRPAGGWTPDMYNYAASVDVYSIWADMVVFDKTHVDLTLPKYYAVYASRRFDKRYVHTDAEIREKYRDEIRMDMDVPEAIRNCMGDHQWTARVKTPEEKDAFIRFVQEELA